jgi:hypothetical protein
MITDERREEIYRDLFFSFSIVEFLRDRYPDDLENIQEGLECVNRLLDELYDTKDVLKTLIQLEDTT